MSFSACSAFAGRASALPDVSVIIVNYNTRDLLRESLASVARSTVSTEVIVVDNGSSDGSAEMIRWEFPGVFLLERSTNEKFAKPNNDGMRIARGKYVLLLNSDAALCPGALELLVNYMNGHTDVGICGPQLLYPDGTIQPSCKGFLTLWTHLCDMFFLDRLFPQSTIFARYEMTYFDHRHERIVDHIMAAAILVRAEAIQTVGLFDEALSIYYNDMDFSLRFHQAGWKTVFVPEAKVVHHGGTTTAMLNTRFELLDELYANVFHYFRIHYGISGLLVYKFLIVAGFIPRSTLWGIRTVLSRDPGARSRLQFSLRSLRIASRLWSLPR